jgi:hypothetical protein
MKLNIILTISAASLLVSCAFDAPYRPASAPEKAEARKGSLGIYPEDVRKDPASYANVTVAWSGIIKTNSAAAENLYGKIRLDTVFEHHYFDWEQNELAGYARLQVSRRGEGLFRMRWEVRRDNAEAAEEDALNYASPGQLAIVYGTPESVDDNGTIVLRYHYIRILGEEHFRDDQLDYGRKGEPIPPR